MKTFTFSGMTSRTVRADFAVAVTLEDIVEHSSGEISFEEIVAWTDEQVREHMMEEKWWFDDLVEDNIGGGHVYDTYYEYDDDMSFDVDEEVEG